MSETTHPNPLSGYHAMLENAMSATQRAAREDEINRAKQAEKDAAKFVDLQWLGLPRTKALIEYLTNYRQACLESCAKYGINLTEADIKARLNTVNTYQEIIDYITKGQ